MDGKVGQTEGRIRASIRPSGLTLSWSPTSAGLVQGALNPCWDSNQQLMFNPATVTVRRSPKTLLKHQHEAQTLGSLNDLDDPEPEAQQVTF